VLTLVDTYAGGIPLLIGCMMEVLTVSYVYGYRRFIGNIKEMMGEPKNRAWKLLGYPVNPFWWICWILITPALLCVIYFAFGSSMGNEKNYTLGNTGDESRELFADDDGGLYVSDLGGRVGLVHHVVVRAVDSWCGALSRLHHARLSETDATDRPLATRQEHCSTHCPAQHRTERKRSVLLAN
jgi:hypothetical protein